MRVTTYVLKEYCGKLSLIIPFTPSCLEQGTSILRITCHASNTLLFDTIALFVRIKLMCSPIRRLPSNRANGEAVFESSLNRYNNHE